MSKEPDVISMTELRNSAREVIENAHFRGRRYVIERAGRPMAVVIGLDDYEQMCDMLHTAAKAEQFNKLRE